MKKKCREENRVKLLPFCIIQSAVDGNVESINMVLQYYERYIIRLSTKELFDQYGNIHYCVDESLRRRLETKLITKILNFKIS